MRKTMLSLLTTFMAAGCATGQFNAGSEFDSSRATLDDCDDIGGTHINLHYSNYQIRTTSIAHLRAGEIFSIRLKPQNTPANRPGVDYEDKVVTISGKTAGSAWLSASGSYSTTPEPHHDLVICVPPNEPPGTYYYDINIVDTGSLDPRADID